MAAILVAGCIAYFGPRLGPIEAVENDLADMRVAILNAEQPQHPEIVIAMISESTFAHLRQRTPVDRAFLADLIAALDQGGSRAIGIDLFFGETTDPEKDRRLIDTLNAVGTPTVLAWADSKSAPGIIAPWQDEAWSGFRAAITNPLVSDGLGILLHDARDQVVRSIFLARGSDGEDPGFAPALAVATGHPPPESWLPRGLAYYGRPRPDQPAFLQIPAESLNPAVPILWERIQPLVQDRIVLIGLDVVAQDRHLTPFALLPEQQGGTPGVVVHAHALAQMLSDSAPPSRPQWLSLLLATAVALAGGFAAHIPGNSWVKGVLLFLGPLTVMALGFILFAGANVMLHILAPSLGYIVAFILTELGMEASQRREIRLLGGAFARYVSPAVISQLRRDPSRLRAGGEEREITVLLTDLAGSVSLGESVPADRFVTLLNGYLDGISRIILAHDGTIDKFIGDAVMALFGAPLDQSDHASRAVHCALAIDAFTTEYSARLKSQGIDFGHTRIGVHSGTAVVGNFGGETRFNYTAIGQVTNICARLEAANKQLGTRLCVSEDTVRLCSDIAFRPIGRIQLRGVATPIAIFLPDAVSGLADESRYRAAYAILEAGNPKAADAFNDLAATHPDDPLVALHGERLRKSESGITIGLT